MFKQKCNAILARLDLPLVLYAATSRDIFRKPRTGMWKEMCEDSGLAQNEIDLGGSVFVGDAGGRTAHVKGSTALPKDFSCADRDFASNLGISYQAPEEFFLGEAPRGFKRDFDLANYPLVEATSGDGDADGPGRFQKLNAQDIVLFVGPPGAGKSTFYWSRLQALGYQRVNQDTLATSVLPPL